MSYLKVNATFAFILCAVAQVVLGPGGEKLDKQYDFAIERRDDFLAFAFAHYRPLTWTTGLQDDEIRFCLERFYIERQDPTQAKPGCLIEVLA